MHAFTMAPICLNYCDFYFCKRNKDAFITINLRHCLNRKNANIQTFSGVIYYRQHLWENRWLLRLRALRNIQHTLQRHRLPIEFTNLVPARMSPSVILCDEGDVNEIVRKYFQYNHHHIGEFVLLFYFFQFELLGLVYLPFSAILGRLVSVLYWSEVVSNVWYIFIRRNFYSDDQVARTMKLSGKNLSTVARYIARARSDEIITVREHQESGREYILNNIILPQQLCILVIAFRVISYAHSSFIVRFELTRRRPNNPKNNIITENSGVFSNFL